MDWKSLIHSVILIFMGSAIFVIGRQTIKDWRTIINEHFKTIKNELNK